MEQLTGNDIRGRREALGLTQRELAQRLRCSPQFLCRVENEGVEMSRRFEAHFLEVERNLGLLHFALERSGADEETIEKLVSQPRLEDFVVNIFTKGLVEFLRTGDDSFQPLNNAVRIRLQDESQYQIELEMALKEIEQLRAENWKLKKQIRAQERRGDLTTAS